MAKQTKSLLEIDLGTNGGLQRFKTPDEISEFIVKEKEFWKWLDEVNKKHLGAFNQTNIQKFLNILENILQTSAILADGGLQIANNKEHINTIQHLLKEIFINPDNGLHSSNPKSKFLFGLKDKEGHSILAYAFLHFINHNNINFQNLPDARRGVFLALMFENGIRPKTGPERKALEDLRLKWDDELKWFREDYENCINNFQEITKNIQIAKDDFTKTTYELINNHKEILKDVSENYLTKYESEKNQVTEQLTKLRSDSETKINNLINTYDVKLKLKAPVSYWESKKEDHKKASIIYSISASLFGISVVSLLLLFLYKAFPIVDTYSEIPVSVLLSFFVLFTFATWTLRILVRLTLSNLHLYNDAQERCVMAETFIALTRGKDTELKIDSEDLSKILGALFRSSTTGIVKDDASPPIIHDYIDRSTKR